MVSQSAAAPSRDRLLAAAAREFADRGYAGARVDRIARTASVTKAMVYYHFASKTALYRAILVDVFRSLADAVATASSDDNAEVRLRRFIRAIAAETATRPHFPAMWLREVADGGRHLDASVIAELGRILRGLGAILDAGRIEGRFRPAHPMLVQMGIVAPLLVFQASAPARERIGRALPRQLPPLDRREFVAHLEATTLAALEGPPNPDERRSKEKRR